MKKRIVRKRDGFWFHGVRLIGGTEFLFLSHPYATWREAWQTARRVAYGENG